MSPQSRLQPLPSPAALLLWILGLCALGALPAGASPAEDEAQRKARLQQLRQEIRQLQGELDQVRDSYDAEVGALRKAERQVGRIGGLIRQIEQRMSAQRRELKRLRREQGAQHRLLEAHREALVAQIRASYAMGRQEQIKLLLNQEDPARVGRMMVYYDYFNRARAEQIARVNMTLERLRELGQAITDQQQQLAEQQQRHQRELRQFEQARKTREGVVARLRTRLEHKGGRLERLRQDELKLTELIESLRDVLAQMPKEAAGGQTPFHKLKGKLPWPSAGRLASRFGRQRSSGSLHWRGVLIASDNGSPVKAISFGQVVFADWLRGFGLLLIVDHGDGYMSLYGHNQSLFKEVGDWVEPAEVIATVGRSGGRRRSGLYFEIRHDGQPINPIRWCERPRGRKVGMIWPES